MTTSGRVCARCAQIKQRCDGNNPCSRCDRLGHVCEPQQPGKRTAESKSQAYRRPRASRSRGGCLSCKARKKKCDELRPRCSDCRRLNLPCRWKPVSSLPASSPRPETSPPSHELDDEHDDDNDRPVQPSEPSADGVDENPLLLLLPPMPETPSDEDPHALALPPTSDPSDEGQALSPTGDTILLEAANLNSTWLTPDPIAAVASPSANPHLHTEEDRSLFNHYLHIVARALSRSVEPDGNPFLTTLLPMAAASDTLTSVILGLSGGHWKRVYPSIWNRALTRQGRAIAQVNRLLIRHDLQSTLEACATVLLLCLTELFDGTSKVWKWHLKAASALLRSAGVAALESTREGVFCLHLFHYLDSMSTISRCKPPLLRDGESLSDLTTTSNTTSTTTINPPRPSTTLLASPFSHTSSILPRDAISGIPPALLDFMGMVNLLAAHRDRRVDELSEIGFRTAASHVQTQLDLWRAEYSCPLGTSSPYPKNGDQATTAFEWAIRLRLHQIVDGYDPHHPQVETAVATILSAVLAIPYGSPVEGSLLFPLVIAGASSTTMERRMVVKERLMVMEHTLGFGHIARARQLLETVWGQESEWNWASVRYTKFPGMVFI